MHVHWEHKKARSRSMTNSQIDEYYELARRNGALGGKLIGAGGGGFLMMYTEDKTRLRHAMRGAGLREVRMRFDFRAPRCSRNRERYAAGGDPGGRPGHAAWPVTETRSQGAGGNQWRAVSGASTAPVACARYRAGGAVRGHMARRFANIAGDGGRFGLRIEYSSDGPVLLGTAGAVAAGRCRCWATRSLCCTAIRTCRATTGPY